MNQITLQCSRRMQAVQDPIIPILADWIRQHPGTISLGQGVVYYGPPESALAAARAFPAAAEAHRYGPVAGEPELRQIIAAKLAQENGIAINERNRVVVTAGANMAFMNALFAITDPGDEIILLSPYYFNHEMAIRMLGCSCVTVATDDNYQPDLTAIEQAITGHTRAVVTISPNNPTGAVYPQATLNAINKLCRERGIYHISDEAYEYFTYNEAGHFSPGSLPQADAHTISLYSLSKAYGFAGWRIGYMAIPEHLGIAVEKAQDTNLICPPLIAQAAAQAALETGAAYCQERVATLADTRRQLLAALQTLGSACELPAAEGAFYILLRLHCDIDAMTLARRLIAEHGVAVVPGDPFGCTDATYLRISYGALDGAAVLEGAQRLCQGLRAIAL
jgi:aspartate/methionine/tyrosine aminotransferase